MAYLFNNQQQGTQAAPQQPQKPQKSPQSTFKDPNQLITKNSNVMQGGANTAATNQAQKQFKQNQASLDKQKQDYQSAQKNNFTQAVDVKADLQGGGNKLAEVLKGPQYKADAFNVNTQQVQAPKDYASLFQQTLAPRQGAFYNQGMAALDANIYKASGQQESNENQIAQQNNDFNNIAQSQAQALQAQLTSEGQAQQAAIQNDARGQLKDIYSGLKQEDARDFQSQMGARQDQQVADAMARAKALGSNVTEAQIRSQLTRYNPTENYVSQNNIQPLNTISDLLGYNNSYSSNLSGDDSDKLDKYIQSNIPVQQIEAPKYDPRKQPGYYGQITATPNRMLERAGDNIAGVFSPRTPNMIGNLGDQLRGLFTPRQNKTRK